MTDAGEATSVALLKSPPSAASDLSTAPSNPTAETGSVSMSDAGSASDVGCLCTDTDSEAEVGELMHVAAHTLTTAVQDARLAQALNEKIHSEPAEPRRRLRGLFSESAANGRLYEVMRHRTLEARAHKEANETVQEMPSLDELELIKAKAIAALLQVLDAPSVGEVRMDAASALVRGVADGRLVEAAERIRAARQERLQVDVAPKVVPSFSKVRTDAASSLARSTIDGLLVEAVDHMARQQRHVVDAAQAPVLTTDVSALKRKALAMFSRAAESGRLDESLSCPRNSAKTRHIDALKMRARHLLSKAVVDPEAKSEASQIEALRRRTAGCFNKAGPSGRLAEVMMNVRSRKSAVPCHDLESIRMRAAGALSHAVADGHLSKELLQTKALKTAEAVDARKKCVEDARTQAAKMFSGAAFDGQLAVALNRVYTQRQEKRVEEARVQAADVLASASSQGRLTEALRAVRVQRSAEDVCKHAAQTIAGAVSDGRLAAVVRGLSSRQPQTEELRQAAARSIAAGLANGQLAATVGAVHEKKLDQVRSQAGSVIAFAAADGRLKDALQTIRQRCQRRQVDSLREDAAEILASTVSDGRLKSAINRVQQPKQPQEMQSEKLRSMAASCFQTAAATGRLQEAVSSMRVAAERAHLRSECLATLASAVKDGRLRTALDGVKANRETDSLKKEAYKTVALAATDGRLQSALETIRQERLQKQARVKAAETISEASKNGRLVEALRNIRRNRQSAVEAPKQARTEVAGDARARAARVLVAASCDGRLFDALQRLQPRRPELKAQMEISSFRAAASARLAVAAADGSLAAALSNTRMQSEDSSENVRYAAAEALAAAAQDGRLRTAFAQQQQADEKADKAKGHRSRVAKLFTTASRDGRLFDALTRRGPVAAQEPSAKLEDLRLCAKTVLSFAALDGRLSAAFSELQQECGAPPPSRNSPHKVSVANVSELLAHAAHALGTEQKTQALAEGSCARLALFRSAEGSLDQALEGRREKAAGSLAKAAADGRLLAAAKKLRLTELRESAASTLNVAASNGSLLQAVAQLKAAEVTVCFSTGQLSQLSAILAKNVASCQSRAPKARDSGDDTEFWDVASQAESDKELGFSYVNHALNNAITDNAHAVLEAEPQEAEESCTAPASLPPASAQPTKSDVAEDIAVDHVQTPRTEVEDEIQEDIVTEPLATMSSLARQASAGRLGQQLVAGSPARVLRRAKRSVAKPGLTAIRIDSPDGGTARESSLARGYEALGAEVHAMDSSDTPRNRRPSAMQLDLNKASMGRSASQGSLLGVGAAGLKNRHAGLAASASTGSLLKLAPIVEAKQRRKLRLDSTAAKQFRMSEPMVFRVPTVHQGPACSSRYSKWGL